MIAILSFGSNVGDRRGHLLNGLRELRGTGAFIIQAVSRLVESEPWGPVPQDPFLNLLVRGEATVEPFALLDVLHRIEDLEGRVRELRYGPRTLDMDIIFFGGLLLEDPLLTLPHPHWQERPFVRDLLPDLVPSKIDDFLELQGVREALLGEGNLSSGLREVAPLDFDLSGRSSEGIL